MSITLKGGITTEDKRLDRVPFFDPRSVENYHIRGIIAPEEKPRSYTWKVPVGLNQGQEGACVGFGWAHWLAASPHWNKWLVDQDGKFIYFNAQKDDDWPGGEYPGASPVYSGTSVIAGAKFLNGLGIFKEYRWVTSLDDMILSIGHHGPVVMGIDWFDNMYTPDDKNFIHVSGPKVGGHCILNHGVDVKRECFKLWNSWDWHECLISFSDAEKLLLNGGEGCVPIGKLKGVPEWPKEMVS